MENAIRFNISFADFRLLQSYMTRPVYRNTDAARYAFVAELHKRLESAWASRNAGVP